MSNNKEYQLVVVSNKDVAYESYISLHGKNIKDYENNLQFESTSLINA